MIKDIPQRSIKNNEELSLLIKEFIELNPISDKIPSKIYDLYNNMYNRDYVKYFAQHNFNNLYEMQSFYYDFVFYSGLKLSSNEDILSYPRIIEILWDGIHGWQW